MGLSRPLVRTELDRALSKALAAPGSGAGASAVYPLDEAGALPAFAYSTKKLTASYAGPCVRIIRPSDSATLDVGFNGQNIDAAAMDTFLGVQIGKVDIWYDQTGNGNHAVQTVDAERPRTETVEINGARVVYFNTHGMEIPATVSVSRLASHVFCVAECFGMGTNGRNGLVQLGSGTDQVSMLTNSVPNGRNQIRLQNGTSFGTGLRQEHRPIIYEARMGAASVAIGQGDEQVTGAVEAAATMVGGQIGDTTLSTLYNGLYYGAAFIGYGRELSAGDRTALRDALNSVYGITESPTVRVSFEGDSLTAASTATNLNFYGYVKQAQRIFPAAHIYNFGTGGAQLQNELALYSAQTGSIIAQYPTDTNIGFLHMGTNDLTVGGRTAAQIYADIQTYAGLVRASGGLAVVSTILPNNAWTAGQQIIWNDLNALIRSGWASFADALADFQADPTIGPFSAAANATLYVDGLHPTRLGHSYMATIAAAAIESLL